MFKNLSRWLDVVTLMGIGSYLIFAKDVRPIPLFIFAVIYCNMSIRLHEREHHKKD